MLALRIVPIAALLCSCDSARSQGHAPATDAPGMRDARDGGPSGGPVGSAASGNTSATRENVKDATRDTDKGEKSTALAPLEADRPYMDLDVSGFGPAVVSVPRGATEARPIVLATHGNYDRPEWQCQVWREIVGDGAFILCPRGIARRDSPSPKDIRFTYANGKALEREIDAGLAALRATFGAHVGSDPIVYTGFSLGAIIGAALAMRPSDTTPYERLVLVEGGHDAWTEQTAKRFAAAGGKKVLFGCGQAGCFPSARKASGQLERAGVQTRIVGVKDAGHAYDGPVARAVSESWRWLLEPRAPSDPASSRRGSP
ncbi:alpha/beta hydrolase [Pendulispora albinea]|uniref:Alpha/beta hydrolase family protein n=1 Tax=Pendulispora albinea TaxID=2741071 RepID=A0ABZ2LUR8_9BACT